MTNKRLISSVTSDLVSDQRVHRMVKTLATMGFEIRLIGRKKKDTLSLKKRSYAAERISTWFEKGPLFYAEFNVRLFFKILFSKADILLANDLDTLLPNYLVSRIKGIPLIYDSHEYFTEVPELIQRKIVRKIWLMIERLCFSGVHLGITVCDPIAQAYYEKYGIEMKVVRNFPNTYDLDVFRDNQAYSIDKLPGEKIILYQGSVNVDRGLEQMIEAMKELKQCRLIICGDGDIIDSLKIQARKLDCSNRIEFRGKIAFEELAHITVQADIGLSIEKQNGLSYTYALPNKFFDYIQAGIPSIISTLPEMIKINKNYNVAVETSSIEPKALAECIKKLIADESRWVSLRDNASKARKELNWTEESKIVEQIFTPFLNRVH